MASPKRPRWIGGTTLTLVAESGKRTLSDRATLTDVYEGTLAGC